MGEIGKRTAQDPHNEVTPSAIHLSDVLRQIKAVIEHNPPQNPFLGVEQLIRHCSQLAQAIGFNEPVKLTSELADNGYEKYRVHVSLPLQNISFGFRINTLPGEESEAEYRASVVDQARKETLHAINVWNAFLGEIKAAPSQSTHHKNHELTTPGPVASHSEQATETIQRLLRLYSGNVANERIKRAAAILASDASTNDKLIGLDTELKIPPTASAGQLGRLLGNVSKQAVIKTSWWTANRRGAQEERSESRANRLRERGRRLDGTE